MRKRFTLTFEGDIRELIEDGIHEAFRDIADAPGVTQAKLRVETIEEKETPIHNA
jgi:serine protease inhibitor